MQYYCQEHKINQPIIISYKNTFQGFNVVVDAVLCHWFNVVAVSEEVAPPEVASKEGFGRDVQLLVA